MVMERPDAEKEHPGNQDPTNAQTPEPAFETPTVSEKLYAKTREALARKGFRFIVAIKPVSVGQLITGKVTSWRFSHVDASENMRSIVPSQMEVAINLKNLRIKNSNYKPTNIQIGMIEKEEAALKGKLPEEVRDFISMRIQHASVLAQVDLEYQERTGKALFTDWFGCTNDETSPGVIARVGRHGRTLRLSIFDWDRGVGGGTNFAVPVVVLPRK